VGISLGELEKKKLNKKEKQIIILNIFPKENYIYNIYFLYILKE